LRAHLDFVEGAFFFLSTNEGVNRREKGKRTDMWQPCRLQNANNYELGSERWIGPRRRDCDSVRETSVASALVIRIRHTSVWCVSINTSASVSAAACHRILLPTRSIRRPFGPFHKASNPQLIIGVSVQAIARPRASALCHFKRHRTFWIRVGWNQSRRR
jgi:hypothetical protein